MTSCCFKSLHTITRALTSIYQSLINFSVLSCGWLSLNVGDRIKILVLLLEDKWSWSRILPCRRNLWIMTISEPCIVSRHPIGLSVQHHMIDFWCIWFAMNSKASSRSVYIYANSSKLNFKVKWPNHVRTIATVWYAVALEAILGQKRKPKTRCVAI